MKRLVSTLLLFPTLAHADGVTMAQFDRVREGMKYDQVAQIFGSKGEQTTSSVVSGHTVRSYVWPTENSDSVILLFDGDRLFQKYPPMNAAPPLK